MDNDDAPWDLRTPPGLIPIAASEYEDEYNLNDIGLAMRLYESTAV